MKTFKNIPCLISPIITAVAFCVVAMSASAESITLQYDIEIPDVSVADGCVSMEGYHNSASPGDPALPVKGISIIVHPDIDWDTLAVKAVAEDFYFLEGSHEILPAPPAEAKLLRDDAPVTRLYYGKDKVISSGRNMLVYDSDEFYPADTVELLPYAQLRKWKMAQVLIQPVRYNPSTGEVMVTKSVTIQISYNLLPSVTSHSNSFLIRDTAGDSRAEAMAINFDEMKKFYQPVEEEKSFGVLSGGDEPVTPSPTYNYCIITTQYIVNNSTKLQAYIEHKESQYYTIMVKTVESIESEYTRALKPHLFESTDERADRIRAFLKDKYAEYGFEYLLLIGNPDPDDPFNAHDSVGDVPMKFCYPDLDINPYYAPTDSYYADLTGRWDLNGDGIYGTWNNDRGPGGVNFATPELHVTRIPNYSTNMSALDSILQKIIDYDINYLDEAWKRKCFMPNPIDSSDYYGREGNTSPVTMAEFIKNTMLIPEGFYYYRIYEHLFTYPPINASPPPEMIPSPLGVTCFTRFNSTRYFKAGFNTSSDNIANYTITELTDGQDVTFWSANNLAVNAWLQFKQSYESDMGASYVPHRIVIRSTHPSYLPQKFKIEMASNANFSDRFTVVTEDNATANAVSAGSYWELVYDYPGNLNKVGSKKYIRLTYTGSSAQSYVQINEFLGYAEENKSIKPYIIPEWQNGYGIVYYNTHGSSTTASEIISSSECWQLDNTKPSFVFQKACSNATPETTNNLCYQLLREGAIGSFGATRISYGWGDHGYQIFLPKLINQNKAFSVCLSETRANMEANNWYGWAGYYFDAMRFNIYGDPTVRLLGDRDGDGMPYWYEEHYGLNPNVNDANGDLDDDGLTNYEEFLLGTDPAKKDTDGDGMPDGWEVDNDLNPLCPEDADDDNDDDGMTNLEEYLAGTDPNDSESVFRFVNITRSPIGALTSSVTITWMSVPGKAYVIEYSDEPFSGTMTWIPADGAIATGDYKSWTDDGTKTGGINPDNTPQRWYRVRVYIP